MLKAATSASLLYQAAVRGCGGKKKTYRENAHTLELTKKLQSKKRALNLHQAARRTPGKVQNHRSQSGRQLAPQGVLVHGRRPGCYRAARLLSEHAHMTSEHLSKKSLKEGIHQSTTREKLHHELSPFQRKAATSADSVVTNTLTQGETVPRSVPLRRSSVTGVMLESNRSKRLAEEFYSRGQADCPCSTNTLSV